MTWSPIRLSLARRCRDAALAMAQRRVSVANSEGQGVMLVATVETL